MNEVNAGIFVTDETGRYTFVNHARAWIHGASDPSDLIRRNILEFVDSDRGGELRSHFFTAHLSGRSESVSEAIILPGGSRRFLEIKPVQILEEGRLTGFGVVVRNVDCRVRAERDLQLSHSILSRVDNVVYVADSQGPIVYVSQSAERVLGYPPSMPPEA